MADEETVCAVDQTQEFHVCAVNWLALNANNRDTLKQDLNNLLDQLNDVDYSFEVTESEEAGRVLWQGTQLIDQSHEILVAKFCQLVVNISKQQIICQLFCQPGNKQNKKLLNSLRLEDLLSEITLSSECLTGILEYFIGALRTCQSWCFPDVLTALGAVLYESNNRFEEYWDCLAGPEGMLIKLASSKDGETEVKRTALKCLENFTFRRLGEPYIGDACVEACFHVFLQALQMPQTSEFDDSVYCRMLLSALRGLQNLITNSKNIHLNSLGPLLASLKSLTFYGLPGQSAQVPHCLYPTPLTKSEPPTLATKELESSFPVSKSNKQSSHIIKKSRKKTSTKKPEGRSWQTQMEPNLLPISTDVDSYVDPLSSIWTPKPSSNSLSISVGQSSSWTKMSSSESEYSDSEGGQLVKVRIFQSKVRTCAYSALLAVVKNTEKKVMFGYLTSFLPDSPTLVGVPQSQTLLTSILKDPSPKVRTSALAVLTLFLDGSKQYLASADDSERHYMAFTPFSMTLALMIKELHRCLLLALVAETSPVTLTQLIKCLSTLILNVPYQKLTSGLLTKLSRHLRQFLSHKDSNVRVACLTTFGSLLSLQPPLPEVAQILTDESPASAYSLSMVGDDLTSSSKYVVRRKDSSPTDFKSVEMHQAFNAMIGGLNGSKKESWLVQVCHENIHASNADSLEADVIVKNTPLPIRLESLQVLAILAKGYFFILRSNVNQLASLVHRCLLDPEASVNLHGARLFEQLAHAMLQDVTSQQPNLLHPLEYTPISVEEIVSVWLHLLDGPLPVALQNNSLPPLRATGCDCLANVGARPFELLPTDYRDLCIDLLLSLAADNDNGVKAEAVRALGVYVLFPSLREDIGFLANAANAIITTMEDVNVSVRIKACWALGNLSDAFVLNRTEGNDLFVEELSDRLLHKLCSIAISAAQDNDKVKCNALRSIGNLLRFMGEKTVAKGNFLEIINQSAQMLIKNITSGNNMKVRWNACYAVGNLFHNSAIPFDKSGWLVDLMLGLMNAIKECKNFKVRINAANALMVPTKRHFYGSPPEFASLWEDAVVGLEMAQQVTSFMEYKYQDNLTHQLICTLCHLTSMVNAEDLTPLNPVLITKKEELQICLDKFKEKLDSDKEGILSGATISLQDLETVEDEVQGASKSILLQLFSVPKINAE